MDKRVNNTDNLKPQVENMGRPFHDEEVVNQKHSNVKQIDDIVKNPNKISVRVRKDRDSRDSDVLTYSKPNLFLKRNEKEIITELQRLVKQGHLIRNGDCFILSKTLGEKYKDVAVFSGLTDFKVTDIEGNSIRIKSEEVFGSIWGDIINDTIDNTIKGTAIIEDLEKTMELIESFKDILNGDKSETDGVVSLNSKRFEDINETVDSLKNRISKVKTMIEEGKYD